MSEPVRDYLPSRSRKQTHFPGLLSVGSKCYIPYGDIHAVFDARGGLAKRLRKNFSASGRLMDMTYGYKMSTLIYVSSPSGEMMYVITESLQTVARNLSNWLMSFHPNPGGVSCGTKDTNEDRVDNSPDGTRGTGGNYTGSGEAGDTPQYESGEASPQS